eukprot:jgi/Hompol1/5855/HPOL_001026-RA
MGAPPNRPLPKPGDSSNNNSNNQYPPLYQSQGQGQAQSNRLVDEKLPPMLDPYKALNRNSYLTETADEWDDIPDAIGAEEYTAAIVPTDDNTDTYSFTFRVVLLGTLWAVALSFANAIFLFRTNPFQISTTVTALLVYPMGIFLARITPDWSFEIAGTRIYLNPGPFNIKEHVLIYIIAGSAGGPPYACDNVVAQKWVYVRLARIDTLRFRHIHTPTYCSTDILLCCYRQNDENVGVVSSLLWVFSTQMIGYGIAGLLRSILVKPTSMVWPSNLSTIALFVSFHNPDPSDEGNNYALSRYSFFWLAFSFVTLWQILPLYFFQVASIIAPLCFFSTNSIVRRLGSGSPGGGFGLFTFSLDWSIISGNTAPLTSPFWATLNLIAGLIIWLWVVSPIFYFYKILHPDPSIQVGHLRMIENDAVVSYEAINSAVLVDRTGRPIRNLNVLLESHSKVNQTAVEELAPVYFSSMYALVYGIAFVNASAVLVHVALWHGKRIWQWAKGFFSRNQEDIHDDTHNRIMASYVDVPDWAYLVFLAAFLALQIIVCTLTPFKLRISGVLLAFFLAVVFVLPFGVISALTGIQPGLNVISEFIIGYALVVDLFANSGIIWGAIGPAVFFGKQSVYNPLLYGFVLGAVLPVIPWLCNKVWPSHYWKLINIPVITAGGNIVGVNQGYILSALVIAFISQHYLFNYHRALWAKYNYVLSVALDVGTGTATLLVTGLLAYGEPPAGKLNPSVQDYYCFGTYEQVEKYWR